MKEDEKYFLKRVYNECKNPYEPDLEYEKIRTPRQLITENDFPINHKRAWYLLEKWESKGWYDWGTSLDFGWLTDKGIEVAKSL